MSKLHPVYVALDSHQYSRAIKLALALPDSNVLGKALLAHAYLKSGQRYQSLLTLDTILGSRFCELKYECDYALDAVLERELQPSIAPEPSPATTASKKGKKGKKKPVPAPKQPTATAVASASPEHDILGQLDNQPSLPENWAVLPPAALAIKDETTLGTMSVTLQGLKLPLTAYQLYSWATSGETSEVILTKTFCLGLTVLAAPSKWKTENHTEIETHVLTHIQTVAMQWARLYASHPPGPSSFPAMLATSWASQTALWQLQWLPTDDKRSMLLPRLAESMAQRLLQQNPDQSQSAEVRLLALRTLEQQSKWAEMLEILEQLPSTDDDEHTASTITSDFGVALTTYQILTEKARVLSVLKNYERAQSIYEQVLSTSCDDWSCWKGHLDCCIQQDKVEETKNLVDSVLAEQAGAKYTWRGPHLMKVELKAQSVRIAPTADSLKALQGAIEVYSQLFAPKAACAFSDLEAYVDLLSTSDCATREDVVTGLLTFLAKLRSANLSQTGGGWDNKEHQTRLRAYIFATKMNHKLLAKCPELQNQWLPAWSELVNEWKATLPLNESSEGEESQKEVKPGDDLILLAVEQLLYQRPGHVGSQVVCATLLESAIQHSPDNAYLKMSAIRVYHSLDALSRSWELYQGMGIKHVQLDSCNFVILPLLFEGGLYNEAIEICNGLLRFQANTARDCGDYAGRAMEGATLSKANEFMVFQRQKMNNSLTVQEAKGMILDAAAVLATAVPRKKHNDHPIMKGCLGIHQGIVGGEDDIARAVQMIVEAHNPYAALSLVSFADHDADSKSCETMVDNRDMSILSHQLLEQTLPPSKERVVQDALRRGHTHGLLIRASLCLDAAKGPKKGKIVKPSAQLEERTKSLLQGVSVTEQFYKEDASNDETNSGYSSLFLRITLDLCCVLAVINTGMPNSGVDSMETREEQALSILKEKVVPSLAKARELSTLSVKKMCSLLPTNLVPLFAMFRMCATLCDIYGWGKRKRNTKRCAGAMAEVAVELNELIEEMLVVLKSLPVSEESSILNGDFEIEHDYRTFLDENMIEATAKLLSEGRFRTRERVEPILQQMDEYFDSFELDNNQ